MTFDKKNEPFLFLVFSCGANCMLHIEKVMGNDVTFWFTRSFGEFVLLKISKTKVDTSN